jgi:hypothetical protein
MEANLMTAAELFALAYEKQQDERDRLEKETDNENKIVKVGYLKHNIYEFPYDTFDIGRYCDDYIFTEEGVEDIIQKFRDEFILVAEKGVKFVCYVIYDGDEIEEIWYRDDSEGDDMELGDDWAKEHLENIEDV